MSTMRTRSPGAAGPPRADHSLSPTRTRPPCESTGCDDDHDLAEQARGAVVEQRIAAVVVA